MNSGALLNALFGQEITNKTPIVSVAFEVSDIFEKHFAPTCVSPAYLYTSCKQQSYVSKIGPEPRTQRLQIPTLCLDVTLNSPRYLTPHSAACPLQCLVRSCCKTFNH